MAYSTGSGTGQQAFLDALRTFALAQGWTINRWDTTAKRLYLSKGVCRVTLDWLNVSVNTFVGTTLTAVSEGRIRGSLCKTIGAADDYSTFLGSAMKTGQLATLLSPSVGMSNMQNANNWFLFSDSGGTYIHAMVQTAANGWTFLGFGIADQGGLTHSGVAYLFSDGMRVWYREQSTTTAPATSTVLFNKPGMTANFAAASCIRQIVSLSHACLHLYSVDALPAGFVNELASASYYTTVAAQATTQLALPMKSRTGLFTSPTDYQSASGPLMRLLDPIIQMSGPGYAPYVPMLGVPLGFMNVLKTQSCLVGMMPDIRIINMTGLTAQQELALGSDTWKVFPQFALAPWSDSNAEIPTSGMFGLAFKKI